MIKPIFYKPQLIQSFNFNRWF